MATISIVFGPHMLRPDNPPLNMLVDGDQEIEVMPAKGNPIQMKANLVDDSVMICYLGDCYPFVSSAPVAE